jgi:glycosyltransferase involved in cell wall biosynthesis
MISVLILTRNEEQDLSGCLDSVAWSDDVWVFDSYSDDRTVEIAQSAGAHLVQRRFDTYAAQRNAAFDTVPFQHEWIFLLDADERLSAPLFAELRQAIADAPVSVAGFRLRRRDHFLGRWLKHAQTTPFYIRLVRRGRARYERDVNEVLVLDGEVRDLAGAFDHYPFSKGLTHWIAKHNSYSSGEAKIVLEQSFVADASWKTALFAKDFNRKHSARKALFYEMPGRPLVRWAYLMFYRRGILDGRAGFVYSTLQAIYEYFIVLKTRELREAAQGRRP